jgi:antitoxin component YwqK of YwqJK toxin-antitoxin module
MKRCPIIIFFVILICGCNRKKVITYYPSGKIKCVYEIDSDSFPDGKCQFFYESGVLQLERNYQHGKKNGLETTYYQNSKVNFIWFYKNDKLDSVMYEFYNNGKLSAFAFMKNDLLDSLSHTYYKSGVLESKKMYSKGKLYLNQLMYSENGVISNYHFYYPEDTLMFLQVFDSLGNEVSNEGHHFCLAFPEKRDYSVNDTLRFSIVTPKPPKGRIRTWVFIGQEGAMNSWEIVTDSSKFKNTVVCPLNVKGITIVKLKGVVEQANGHFFEDSSQIFRINVR